MGKILEHLRQRKLEQSARQADEKAARQTSRVKALRNQAEALYAAEGETANKRELRLLADELRYTDPVSGKATEEFERRLADLLTGIGHQKDEEERGELIRRAVAIVRERSSAAKAGK